MYPDGNLGKTWFGTTPEESDLMASAVANVRITDTGVAVTQNVLLKQCSRTKAMQLFQMKQQKK